MLKFYLRAAIAIVSATLCTLFLLRTFFDTPVDEISLHLLGGHASLHAQFIAQTPPAERRAAVATLSKALGYPVRTEQSSGGSQLRSEWRAGNLYVIVPVPGAPGQLAFGPLPHSRLADLPVSVSVAVLVALLAAWLGVRPLVERVRVLESASARMCLGDFSVRVHNEPGEILDGVGGSLNQLADRIGQLLSDERDLLRTVAHEVRAPISRMRFRVERVIERADESLRKNANGLVSDLHQVDNLFEELLTYVAFDEFDYERPPLQTVSIEVAAAVRRITDEVTSTNDSVTVTVQGAEEARVVANQKLFDRAVTNLLLNAVAYGPPRITIQIRDFAEECVVDVQDSGPGIPELDRPKVTRPFVRLATKKTKGTGLGLAIVKRIMNLHHGRLHILDAPSGGASIQLVWKNANYKPAASWRRGYLTSFTKA